MSKPEVRIVELNEPIIVIGKHFKGDYSKSIEFITEVQKELADEGITFIPNKVFGIYYDNPQDTKADDLKSFQGVLPAKEFDQTSISLTTLEIDGKFIYTKVFGDPMNALMEGYGALFSHIQSENVQLKSNTGYQISTFENGELSTEIYMETN
jgi:DNA gyrase inhibitor GyrI